MKKFTVCIPLYNKEDTIVRAIESVANQIYTNFNVLIIDDGSTDNSYTVITNWVNSQPLAFKEKFNIVRQRNSGDSRTRNQLFRLSEGEFVAFLDADDEWLHNHLSVLDTLINNYTGIYMYSTAFWIKKYDQKLRHNLIHFREPFEGKLDFFDAMSLSSGFTNSSVSCFNRVKCLPILDDKQLDACGDMILWSKSANFRGVGFSSKPTAIIHHDASEASLKGTLSAFSYVFNTVKSCSKSWSNKHTVRKYLHIYLLKNIAGLKLLNNQRGFLALIFRNIRKRNLIITLYASCMIVVSKKTIRSRMLFQRE